MDQKDIQAAIKSCKDRIKSITSVPDYQPGKRQRKRAIELEYVKIATLTQPAGWISVEDRLPGPEKEVLILAVRKNEALQYTGTVITTAMYEDGKISTEDSEWNWYDLDFDYDEENDRYLIPRGWWEYRHYNPDDVYNCCVDDVVTHWMPLPDLPGKEDE